MADEFLTVAEIAELLKLNPQTIRNWIDQGSLEAVRVGSRRVRVRRSELDRFLTASQPARKPSPAKPDPSGQLGSAVEQTLRALDRGDRVETLVPALRKLASQARKLANAVERSAAKQT